MGENCVHQWESSLECLLGSLEKDIKDEYLKKLILCPKVCEDVMAARGGCFVELYRFQ